MRAARAGRRRSSSEVSVATGDPEQNEGDSVGDVADWKDPPKNKQTSDRVQPCPEDTKRGCMKHFPLLGGFHVPLTGGVAIGAGGSGWEKRRVLQNGEKGLGLRPANAV